MQTDTEVDIVLETSGEVVQIEIKAGEGVGVAPFKGLQILENESRKRFKRNVVLHAEKKVFYSAKTYSPYFYNLSGCHKVSL